MSPKPFDLEDKDEAKFRIVGQMAMRIYRRIDLFCSLPLEKMEKLKLLHTVVDIENRERLNPAWTKPLKR